MKRSYREENLLEGVSRFYSREGVCLSETVFEKGRRVGEAKQWDLSGNLVSIQRYREGVLHGKQEYYYPNGQLRTELHYNKGKLCETARLFWIDGKEKRVCTFTSLEEKA